MIQKLSVQFWTALFFALALTKTFKMIVLGQPQEDAPRTKQRGVQSASSSHQG